MTTPSIVSPAARNTLCQESTVSSVPSTIIDIEALRRELVESSPHTRPYLFGEYQTEMILAMDGQLAAIANSVKKLMMERTVAEVPQLKLIVRRPVIERATRKTLRPPSQSAITPVRSLPVIIPAIPQAAISP